MDKFSMFRVAHQLPPALADGNIVFLYVALPAFAAFFPIFVKIIFQYEFDLLLRCMVWLVLWL